MTHNHPTVHNLHFHHNHRLKVVARLAIAGHTWTAPVGRKKTGEQEHRNLVELADYRIEYFVPPQEPNILKVSAELAMELQIDWQDLAGELELDMVQVVVEQVMELVLGMEQELAIEQELVLGQVLGMEQELAIERELVLGQVLGMEQELATEQEQVLGQVLALEQELVPGQQLGLGQVLALGQVLVPGQEQALG